MDSSQYPKHTSKKIKIGVKEELNSMQNGSVSTRWTEQPLRNDRPAKRGRGLGRGRATSTGRGRGRGKANPAYSCSDVNAVIGESESLLRGLNGGLSEREMARLDRSFNAYQQRLTNDFNAFMKTDEKVLHIETRASLAKLAVANRNLLAEQKKWIEEVGFLSITKIQFEHLDRELIRWILGKYKPDEGLIVMDNIWEIDISELETYRALGLPNVGDDVSLHGKAGVEKYGKYFTVVSGGRIDINELGKRLETLKSTAVLDQDKEEFLSCYLIYVFAILLFPDTSLNIKVEYLNGLVDLENVKYLNWAKECKL